MVVATCCPGKGAVAKKILAEAVDIGLLIPGSNG
jgi:hypothetical protein